MSTERIVNCKIHPGIGVARVGNSPEEFFLGPEVPGVSPEPQGGFKDAEGRIKRQAARFRIYGYDSDDRVVRELTGEAEIEWTVHLANVKAAWYRFKIPLDIPEAARPNLPEELRCTRRNPEYRGDDRSRLVINPGRRTIVGKDENPHGNDARYRFEVPDFFGHHVRLGELRTGPGGALFVLGGTGMAGMFRPDSPLEHFANNDGWYDDISDGPVTARVVLNGRTLPVDPAWVIVAPPDYAPGIGNVVTLYDVAYDTYLRANLARRPDSVSFARDVLPILERFDRLQWVNEGFYRGYGWKGEVAVLEEDRLRKLARASAQTAADRRRIFERFRDPSYRELREDAWPRIYGDGFDMPPGGDPRQYLTVTREQYRCLAAWAQGDFEEDWTPRAPKPRALVDLPLSERPRALDRAALEACDGGAFHPGWEVTWPMRHASMYADLCRLKHRAAQEPDYGDELTAAVIHRPSGPLQGVRPGGLTRWMAVPWQTDSASCGSAYRNSTVSQSSTGFPDFPGLPDLPTFWPASVPNKVLTEEAYRGLLDGGLDPAERRAAFGRRRQWSHGLPLKPYTARLDAMVEEWDQLGIIQRVQRQPGQPDDPTLPSVMYVERERGRIADAAAEGGGGGGDEEDPPAQPLVENWRQLL